MRELSRLRRLLLLLLFFLFCACSLAVSGTHSADHTVHLIHQESHSSIPCLEELSDMAVTSATDASLYNATARVSNPLYNARLPPFVVLPRSAEDVQRAIRCAHDRGVRVGVKAGGHSFAGYSSVLSDGDFMLSMANMTAVEWLEDTVVRVQTGARWRDVYLAFRAHGGLWVVTGGLCPSVGVAGFSMGGGVGPVARQYGLAVDNLLSFTVVTVDGARIVVANATQNADLFWALRGGGGGNFGVVTDMTFAVHRGPPTYTWAELCYAPNETSIADALRILGQHAPSLPGTVNVDATLDATDGLCLWVVSLHSLSETQQLLQPFLQAAHPPSTTTFQVFDCFWELIEAYAAKHGYSEYSDTPFRLMNVLVPVLDARAVQLMLDATFRPPVPPSPKITDLCDLHLIQFGGAIRERVSPHDTAFYWRQAEYMMYASCGFSTPDEEQLGLQYLRWWYASAQPLSVDGGAAYVNFLDPAMHDWERVFYGGNLPRLREVMRKWNPSSENPLRFPQQLRV